MTRYSSTMSEILSQIREGFSPKQIKMAIGIASDKRYKGGNMTGAVNAIEKIKKGLSDHPQVAAVLKRQNEDNDEPASPDEGSMATDQLEFIKYAADEIMQHIQNGGEFPEWMQNKLSGTHEKMKGLHANINHENVQEGKSSTGYELYHKDFSSAMQHAYAFAKQKFGIEVDPKEIDDKVASGPRKPAKGKTNSYRLLGKDGKKAIQVQVYGMDNGKYELNMYKEESLKETALMIAEKLKVSDGLGAWIDDFKKSDAPQFQGKSDEQKQKMAIAAFVDAGGKLESVEEEKFAGWIAIFKGKKLEIKKDQAKDLWGAKQLAIKTLKVPKSQQGLLAVEPAYEEFVKEETLEELAMPRKDFEKLKKGDKVTITYDSSIRRGTTTTFTVTGKSKSAKYDVEKVSMTADGKGKYYLYSRKGGDATLALGDMGATMTKIVKEEGEEPQKPDSAKAVEQGREDKKKTRIAQLQLQIAKAQETINKLNAQEKPSE